MIFVHQVKGCKYAHTEDYYEWTVGSFLKSEKAEDLCARLLTHIKQWDMVIEDFPTVDEKVWKTPLDPHMSWGGGLTYFIETIAIEE